MGSNRVFVHGGNMSEALANAEAHVSLITAQPEFIWVAVPGTFRIVRQRHHSIGRTIQLDRHGNAGLRADTWVDWEVEFTTRPKCKRFNNADNAWGECRTCGVKLALHDWDG